MVSYNKEDKTFEKVESELKEIMNELENKEVESVCKKLSKLSESDYEEGDQIEDITIQSETIPRFSCANHKLNLVVRSAITKHPVVCEHLKN